MDCAVRSFFPGGVPAVLFAGAAVEVGMETSKRTLLRDARQSFEKCPGLPKLKQVHEYGLREGVRHGWVLGRGS